MEELLTPVTIIRPASKRNDEDGNTDVEPKTINDVLRVLENGPSEASLATSIKYLGKLEYGKANTKASQAANLLVTRVVPDWWERLSEHRESRVLKENLLEYLRSPKNLALITSRLKTVIAAIKATAQANDGVTGGELRVLLEVLAQVLEGNAVLFQLFEKCMKAIDDIQQRIAWKETASLVASGRIISIVAEAEDVLKSRHENAPSSWLSQGDEYCKWLARNLSFATLQSREVGKDTLSAARYLADALGKALLLGYQGMHIFRACRSYR